MTPEREKYLRTTEVAFANSPPRRFGSISTPSKPRSPKPCPHCYPPEIEQLEEAKDDIEALEAKVAKLETDNAKLREALESVMRLNPEGRNYAEHARRYAGAGLTETC